MKPTATLSFLNVISFVLWCVGIAYDCSLHSQNNDNSIIQISIPTIENNISGI